MVKSNQQVIEAYEKSMRINEGADKMGYETTFEEMLEREQRKFDSKNLTKQKKQEKKRAEKESTTPVLPKSYTDGLQRYRTVARMSSVADMNVFKKR